MNVFFYPTVAFLLLFQKINDNEKKLLKDFFLKENRTEKDLIKVLELIKNNNIISECYKKAEHYINLASNSLNIFQNSYEKNILKNLTTFSLERNF